MSAELVEFGSGSVYADGPEVVVVLGASGIRASDPAELREVAADMLMAAEWIEATA